jgi:hypothetical protein
MQRCPFCGCVYDESDYAGCPNCYTQDTRPTTRIVYDKKRGMAVELSEDEFYEFIRDNPEWQ